MSKTKHLMIRFFDACEKHEIDFTMFNFGLHEDSVEVYTAQEHDEHRFHRDMGGLVYSGEEMEEFLLSVVRQNQYYKKKMEEE